MATSARPGHSSSKWTSPANAVTVEVPIRFGDIDAYGHLNNVATLAILEEARIQLLWDTPGGVNVRSTAVVDAKPGGATAMLVASQRVEYLKPIAYRSTPIPVDMWVGKLGAATLLLNYLIWDSRPVTTTCVVAETLLVCAEPTSNVPRRLTAVERSAWEPLLAERIRFRDR